MSKSLSDFKFRQGMSLLLQGVHGTGKTSLALHFPRPYLIDADNNLAGCIRRIASKNLPFKWDNPNETPTGEVIDFDKNPRGRWERFLSICTEAYNDPDIDTVILDSATAISDFIIDAIKKDANISRSKNMEIQHWLPFIQKWTDLICMAKAQSKTLILIGHEEQQTDPLDGRVKRMLLLPSKARAKIPAMFSDVWETAVENKIDPKTKETVYSFIVRTRADNRVADLKSSLSVPTTFEATWDTIATALNIPLHAPTK